MAPFRRPTPGVQVLDVLLNDTEVGTLTRFPDDRTLFAFNEDYAKNPDRPVLSLSYKTVSGEVRSPARPTRVKVPPFFSNLLPEGHLRRYLAERAGVNPKREFFLLWLLGHDLPGGVIVRPADGEELPPVTSERGQAAASDLLRFSLAGVQLKFSAVLESDGGLTVPASGIGGKWIVKLPSARFSSVPENEYVMMELARAVGIQVPETRLVAPTGLVGIPEEFATQSQAFAVRRFDRDGVTGRRHIEDFAQVFGVFPKMKYDGASYEDLARVLWPEAGLASVVEFVRRLAFSALVGNADMHLKNWSLVYNDPRTPELSPAYDFVSTVPYIPDPEMALSLGGTKRMADVSLDRFARFAARAGVPETPVLKAVRDVAGRLREEWSRNAVVGILPRWLQDRIDAHMKTVPLFTAPRREKA
jgi:serine/threonine-protein kinase HipA